MDMENRIRTRAYFKWLERPAKGPPSELDDWLAAEREELALDLVDAATEAVLPEPSFTQDDAWYGSDRIANLFGLLKPRVRKRRSRSYMLSLIDEYQDYLTSSAAVGDVEANRQASNALRIYRIVASLKVLVGDSFARTATHTLRKELKDLFAEDQTAFETAEFKCTPPQPSRVRLVSSCPSSTKGMRRRRTSKWTISHMSSARTFRRPTEKTSKRPSATIWLRRMTS